MDYEEEKIRKKITKQDIKDDREMEKRRRKPGAQSGVQVPDDPKRQKVPTKQITPRKKPKKMR